MIRARRDLRRFFVRRLKQGSIRASANLKRRRSNVQRCRKYQGVGCCLRIVSDAEASSRVETVLFIPQGEAVRVSVIYTATIRGCDKNLVGIKLNAKRASPRYRITKVVHMGQVVQRLSRVRPPGRLSRYHSTDCIRRSDSVALCPLQPGRRAKAE